MGAIHRKMSPSGASFDCAWTDFGSPILSNCGMCRQAQRKEFVRCCKQFPDRRVSG
jgi:hypothetical protein